MGYKYSFVDNETYGADDINAAIGRLITDGVAIYPTDENLISGMNAVTAELATEGVEYNLDACRVVDAEEGYIKIMSGTVFFENGITMTIDSEGISLEKENERNVYLCYNIETNSCYAELGETVPEQNYVLLAYIDEAGEIIDRRSYAQSKLTPNSPPRVSVFKGDVSFVGIYVDEVTALTLDTGNPNVTLIGFQNDPWETRGVDVFDENGYTSYMNICGTRNCKIRFKKTDGKVEVRILRNGDAQRCNGMKFFVV